MAATGPYILQKSTQLCFAVRSNVNFEQINSSLNSKLQGVMLPYFPNGADTLPPRINLKSLTTAMKVACEKLRLEREKIMCERQNGKQQRGRRRLHRHQYHTQRSRPREKHAHREKDFENRKTSSEVVLLGAGGFFWHTQRITDEDLAKCTENLRIQEHEDETIEEHNEAKHWEKLAEEEQLSVYRRHMDSGIYEYKVFGSFYDINARSFFFTQIDTGYRKVWDQYALKLDIIDKDPSGDCEVLHWVMKYPYPLTSRDYVFIRKSKVDEESKKMILLSKSTSHPKCPEKGDHVRVLEYGSQMVIRPHRTFDEDGMDFVLSYYDNPRVTIPSVCTSFATSAGIPNFIKKLHVAAKGVQQPVETCFMEESPSKSTSLIRSR